MNTKPISQLLDLSGRVAIITGGALGIGLGITKRLAEANAKVVIVDLNPEAGAAAEKQIRELGGEALFIQADVSNESSVENAVAGVFAKFGKIDVLVNNAGIYPSIPVLQLTSTDFEKIINVNLKSVFLFTRAVSEIMIENKSGGKIINITSVDAVHPSSVGLATYDASKHGVWGFTKNVALELAPHNIQVNAITPGGINTPGTGAESRTPQMDEIMKKFAERIPMHRMGEPDDIAKVALFLASDMSSYMTGSQIIVDGGVLLS